MYPEKNLSEQRREPTTNSTHLWRLVQESNPGNIRGRRAPSPLRHSCPQIIDLILAAIKPRPKGLTSSQKDSQVVATSRMFNLQRDLCLVAKRARKFLATTPKSRKKKQ